VLIVVFVLIIIAVVAVFSVQNAVPISVTFLSWHFDASLAVVILLSVLVGMVIGMIVVTAIWLQRASMKRKEAGAQQGGGPQ
jgi:uncharacterized integral membrane protein